MKELMEGAAKIADATTVLLLPKPGCVLKVGDGRGFVFEYLREVPQSVLREARGLKLRLKPRRWLRVVVTAAHCLGKLPPAHAMAYAWEKTYKLLGSLDGGKANICAECLFVDPVSDIAVLGAPDDQGDQEMYEQAEAYESLVEVAPALRIGKPRTGRGWILSLDGHWVPTPMKVHSTLFGVALSTGPTEGGMSGSPILNDAGLAVGVVVVGAQTLDSQGNAKEDNLPNGPQPILSRDLPARFVGCARAAKKAA
jgi:Trypsin-like peptidase domain